MPKHRLVGAPCIHLHFATTTLTNPLLQATSRVTGPITPPPRPDTVPPMFGVGLGIIAIAVAMVVVVVANALYAWKRGPGAGGDS